MKIAVGISIVFRTNDDFDEEQMVEIGKQIVEDINELIATWGLCDHSGLSIRMGGPAAEDDTVKAIAAIAALAAPDVLKDAEKGGRELKIGKMGKPM